MADQDTTQTGTATAAQGAAPKREFSIPQEVQEKYADLVELILGSASMNDDERQYWFSILPIMTQEQVQRLRDILTTEKQKLTEIDNKYQKQLDDINQKHLLEWQEIKRKEQKDKLVRAETQTKQEEVSEEEALLQQLNGI